VDAVWVGPAQALLAPRRVTVLMFPDRSNLGAYPDYGWACLGLVGYVPRSYREFIKARYGCDGAAGQLWCILYPIEQVVEVTRSYREATLTEGVIFIGTDGGGEAFIIDYNTSLPTFASMAYIGDGLEDALYRDETLDGFVAKLSNA
jgi:hypothetical protein